MSASDTDFSPFDEEKKNRLVWIVPSVVLHLIILAVWLAMPKQPPREPSQRKLTINSDQAEQLQQHVEDANLILLHSKVSELQAIKQAMARIRENKMEKLRTFETEMVQTAPKDAKELFTRFMSAQSKILRANQQLLTLIGETGKTAADVKPFLENEDLAGAAPKLVELGDQWDRALAQLQIISDETSLTYALVNTGEIKLEWILDPAIDQERAELNQAMETARSANGLVSNNIQQHFGGRAANNLNDLITRTEQYTEILKNYADAEVTGKAEAEKTRREIQKRIAETEAAITESKAAIEDLNARKKALGKSKETQKEFWALNDQIKTKDRELSNLNKKLKEEKNRLEKTRYSPDRQLEKQVDGIKKSLNNLKEASSPDIEMVSEAVKAQLEVIRSAKDLLETIAQQSNTSTAGASE